MDASGHRRSLLLDHTALAHPPFHTLVETSPKTADRLYRSHIFVLLHPVPRPVDRRLPVVVDGVPRGDLTQAPHQHDSTRSCFALPVG